MGKAKLISPITRQSVQRQRVAAYCRVSSNSADQLNSYAAQIRVYTKLINNKPEWELVDIFADEGLSGTKAETRPEFQRMIHMCERREIDLVITKSVSRFARNVPESLEYARKLKLLGIGIQFEKEGINTLAMGDEMLLNTFSAIAQEESQSISQNLRLANVKRMELGEYVSSCAAYGYRLVDKALVPYEPEAKVVRDIFGKYLQGWSTNQIAKYLNESAVPSKFGHGTWTQTVVKYIITNERYIGDSKFQKKYAEPTVPFKRHKNRGEMDMFYVKATHPAILDAEVYYQAQELIKRRQEKYAKNDTLNTYPLTSRIRCSECGSFYHRKVRGGIVKWVCGKHSKDAATCPASYYSEERIYDGLASVINKLRFGEEDILAQVIDKLEAATTTYKRNNKEASDLSQSIAEINAKLLVLDQLRSKGYLEPEIHQAQTIDLRNQLNKIRAQRSSTFETKITEMLEQVRKLKRLIDELEEPMEVFDERLLVECITDIHINNCDEMTVTMLGGLEFKEQL